MSYSLLSVGTATNNGTGNDFAAVLPSSFSAGDLLLGFSRARATSDTFTTPSGWTLLHSNLNNGSIVLFAKIAAGGDAAPTISWSGTVNVFAQIAAFNGTVYSDLSTIVDASSSVSGTQSALTVSALTVGANNCLIIGASGKNKTVTSDGVTTTVSGGFTEIAQSTATGSQQLNAWGYIQQTAATNISQTDWTVSVTESLSRNGICVSLKSSSGGIPRTTSNGGFSELTGGFRG